ncbi:hypothetical protein EG68_09565 [Paragonimus skrjabini miyazakii]|uniref:Uncharacterized protein n=1 Tax=Paragonimus skrjabini miyazakii TaxID=59628 RepID=A0A8S9YH10_9TREM|nr:hypothetical protein EG68_09565 [Paragonimus skrjabini miyazakii]
MKCFPCTKKNSSKEAEDENEKRMANGVPVKEGEARPSSAEGELMSMYKQTKLELMKYSLPLTPSC